MPRPSKRKRKYDQEVASKMRRNILATGLLLLAIASAIGIGWWIYWNLRPTPTLAFSARYVNYKRSDQLLFAKNSTEKLFTQFGKIQDALLADEEFEIDAEDQEKFGVPDNLDPDRHFYVAYLNAQVFVNDNNGSNNQTPVVSMLDPDGNPQGLIPELKKIAGVKARMKVVLLDAGDFGWSPYTPDRKFNNFADKLREYFESPQASEDLGDDFWLITSHSSFESSLVLHSEQSTVFAKAISLALTGYQSEKYNQLDVFQFYTEILKNTRRLTRGNNESFLQNPLLFHPGDGAVLKENRIAVADTFGDENRKTQIVFEFDRDNPEAEDTIKEYWSYTESKKLDKELTKRIGANHCQPNSIKFKPASYGKSYAAKPWKTSRITDDFLYRFFRLEKTKDKDPVGSGGQAWTIDFSSVSSAEYDKDFEAQIEFATNTENIAQRGTDETRLSLKKQYVDNLRSEFFDLFYYSRLTDAALANGLLPAKTRSGSSFAMSLREGSDTVVPRLRPSFSDQNITQSRILTGMSQYDDEQYQKERKKRWSEFFTKLTSLPQQSLYCAEQSVFLRSLSPEFSDDENVTSDDGENGGDNSKDAKSREPSNFADDHSSFPSNTANTDRARYRQLFLSRVMDQPVTGGINRSLTVYSPNDESENLLGKYENWGVPSNWPFEAAISESSNYSDLALRLVPILGRVPTAEENVEGKYVKINWDASEPELKVFHVNIDGQKDAIDVDLDQQSKGIVEQEIDVDLSTKDVSEVWVEIVAPEVLGTQQTRVGEWITWLKASKPAGGDGTIDYSEPRILKIKVDENEASFSANKISIDLGKLIDSRTGLELTKNDVGNKPIEVSVVAHYGEDRTATQLIRVHFPQSTQITFGVKQKNPMDTWTGFTNSFLLTRWGDLAEQEDFKDVQQIKTLTNVKSQYTFTLNNDSGRPREFQCQLYNFALGDTSKIEDDPTDWYPGEMGEKALESIRKILADRDNFETNLKTYFQLVGQNKLVIPPGKPTSVTFDSAPPAAEAGEGGPPPAPPASGGVQTTMHGMLVLVTETDASKPSGQGLPGWYQFVHFDRVPVRDYFTQASFQADGFPVGKFAPPLRLKTGDEFFDWIGKSDLIQRPGPPEGKEVPIAPIAVTGVSDKTLQLQAFEIAADDIEKLNKDPDSFGDFSQKTEIFVDVFGVPRVFRYRVPPGGGEPIIDMNNRAHHFALRLADSSATAWPNVEYRNGFDGLKPTSQISPNLRGAIFSRNQEVWWNGDDLAGYGPRVLLHNKTADNLQGKLEKIDVRLMLDRGEDSVRSRDIYSYSWNDIKSTTNLYHDRKTVFKFDNSDGKLTVWCDVNDHQVEIRRPAKSGPSTFALRRVWSDSTDPPTLQPVTFWVNQSPLEENVGNQALVTASQNKVELVYDKDLADQLANINLEFDIKKSVGTVYRHAILSIAPVDGEAKPVNIAIDKFYEELDVPGGVNLEDFLKQRAPKLLEELKKFHATPPVVPEPEGDKGDAKPADPVPPMPLNWVIKLRAEDMYGVLTNESQARINFSLKYPPRTLPPPPPVVKTNVTIFLNYKAKKDEKDQPIKVAIRRSNNIIVLDKMSVNGNPVKLQQLTESKGQVVKIGNKEYQVKKYLDNEGPRNDKGKPAIVIEQLLPGKYTVSATVTADFSGRVNEQSTGTVTFEVKSGEESKPEFETDLFFKDEQ